MINLWKLYVVKTHIQNKFAIHHNEDIYFSDVELMWLYSVKSTSIFFYILQNLQHASYHTGTTKENINILSQAQ